MTSIEVKSAIQALAVELESPSITDARREEISSELHRYETLLRAIETQVTADMINLREQELAIAQAAMAKARALQS